MASYRRLPSGLWQATVRLPGGRRVTQTDPLKKVLVEWADQTAADARRGTWRDPRTESLTVGEWHTKWQRGRIVEQETARADESSWRIHIREHFERRPLRDLTKTEIETWVASRSRAGAGPAAVRRALNYLKALLEAAADNELVAGNVARKVDPPPQNEKLPDWFTRREVEAIVRAMRAVGRESDAVMTELMCWVGLRWGEAAGLLGSDIDWLRKTVHVHHALTQAGKDKAYPKTSSSNREVPVPDAIVKRMAALMVGRDSTARIFVTRRGARNLSASNWRTMFEAALERAGVDHGTPHTCRHTAASWLVQAGTPMREVQRQLGHRSVQTTEIYAHLAPDQRRAVLRAWEQLDDRQNVATLRRSRRGL